MTEFVRNLAIHHVKPLFRRGDTTRFAEKEKESVQLAALTSGMPGLKPCWAINREIINGWLQPTTWMIILKPCSCIFSGHGYHRFRKYPEINER